MATLEQMNQMHNAMQQTMTAAIQQMLNANQQLVKDQLVETLKLFGQHTKEQEDKRSGGLNERRFREIGAFDGKDDEWKEFALKFRATVKETDPKIFGALMWAEAQTDEILEDEIANRFGEDDGVRYATAVYNRLIHHLKWPALTIHQGVVNENGLEAWRVLAKRYDPMTPMRGLELMLKTVVPGKIKKGEDVQTRINKWEGHVNALKRDSRMSRI